MPAPPPLFADNFDLVFESQAEAAREVVDAALHAWETVITNFNDGNNTNNVFTVTIMMDPNNNDGGAHAETPGVANPLNGIPDSGTIVINANRDPVTDAVRWFVDPTPHESSEFMGTIINAFTADASDSAVAGRLDLFSFVAHEMAHLLGMSWDEDFIWEDMADDDNDQAIQPTGQSDAALTGGDDGDLWRYYGGGVKALFTTYNSSSPNNGNSGFPIHIAQPHPQNVYQDFYGAEDLGNATLNGGRRYLPSLLLSRYLKGVYLYDTTWHNRFPNFYAHLDDDGKLLVRGGGVGDAIYSPPLPATGDSSDVITLSSQGNDLVVEVDIGTHVPGTGVNTVFTRHFPINKVDSIDIFGYDGVNWSGGNDSITLDFSNGNWCPTSGITVDGGDGANQLLIKGPPGLSNSYDIYPDPTTGVNVFIGGSFVPLYCQNIEELTVMAEPNSSNNTMQVLGTGDLEKLVLVGGGGPNTDTISVIDTGSALLDLEINALGGPDLITVEKLGLDTLLKVDAGGGNDLVILGANVGTLHGFPDAKVHQVEGGPGGQDLLLMQDLNTTSDRKYDFDVDFTNYPGGEGIISRSGLKFFSHHQVEQVTLDAGSGKDEFWIAGTPVDMHLTVLANEGDDKFFVGSNAPFPIVGKIHSLVAIHGGIGTNTATVDDSGDGTGDTVTVTESTVGAGPSDDFFGYKGKLEYHELDDLTIHTTGGHDVINVESTAYGTDTTIYAGRGNDQITVAGPPDTSGQNPDDIWTVDLVKGLLTVDGQIGDDHLTVDDTSDTTGDTVTVTKDTVGMGSSDTFFGSGGGLVYTSIAQLRLNTGMGNEDLFVESTHGNTETFIKAGEGHDNVVVKNAAGTANDVRNLLDVDGQNGDDTLILEDGAEPLPTVVTVSWKQVGAGPSDNFFNWGGHVTYSHLEELTVNAGTSDDTIFVEGTAPGTETKINAGDGIDLITVEFAGTVNVVRSPLTIDGGGGPTNVVALIDSADPTQDDVAISAVQVFTVPGGNDFFGPGGSFAYSNLSQLNLVTGQDHDTINIRSTNPGTEMLIGGGGGDDTFLVDSNGQAPGGDLDLILSEVTLIGGLGNNALLLDDSDDTTGDTVTVTPTAKFAGNIGMGVSDDYFPAGGGLFYDEFHVVALRTSDTQADTINVTPSPTSSGAQLAIDAKGTTFSGPPPGDRLNLNLAGVIQPKVRVLAPGTGVLDSTNHASVFYADVETVDTLGDPNFDLVLNMNAPLLPGNDTLADEIRAFSGSWTADEKLLELKINGATAFVGVESAVNSLKVKGSSDADTFTILETADGLPSFPGTALGSHTNAVFDLSPRTPKNVGIHFNGGPSAAVDTFGTALIAPDEADFSDTLGLPNSGVLNVNGVFTMSYESITPLLFTTSAGGSLLVDATLLIEMTTLAQTDLGDGVRQIDGDGGFETIFLEGFDDVTVRPPETLEIPDLAATAFDADSDHVLGGWTTVTFTVENLGTAAAEAFDVNVVYSDDQTIGNAGDMVVLTVSCRGLAEGDTWTESLDVQLPVARLYYRALAEDPPELGNGYTSTSFDLVGIAIDPNNVVDELDETNNANEGNGVDKDAVTYFPWDVDDNLTVTPTDAMFLVNRLLQSVPPADYRADPDGDGSVTQSEVNEILNRLGYAANGSVIESGGTGSPATGPPAAVELTMELVDRDGVPGLVVGEAFDVEVYFADASGAGDPRAVFSGYADVQFDPASLRIDAVTYDSDYAYLRTGTIDNADGRAGDVGATGGSAGLPDTRLFTLHLTALATGPTAITSGKSDELVSQIVVSGNESDQRDRTNFGGLEITVTAGIVARHVFYNNSAFDDVVAPDKMALLPGGVATFANYTSYALGINGIMVDLADSAGTITADDFLFQVGNSDDPVSWREAPDPLTVTVREDAGIVNSDRVVIIWPDHAIKNQWLQVTVLANDNTGLPEDEVFCFGSAVGESGNSAGDAQVTTTDLLLARNNPRNLSDPAQIEFPYDFNRDQQVNRTDVLLARNNQTNFLNALKLIDLSSLEGEGEGAAIEQLSASDAVFSEAAAGESQSGESWSAEMDWLSEIDELTTPNRSSQKDNAEKDNSVEKAVDQLLETFR